MGVLCVEETREDLGHNMIVPSVVLSLLLAPLSKAGKIRSPSSPPGECQTNYDCSEWAPYCSDFGFCQWTDKFGDHPGDSGGQEEEVEDEDKEDEDYEYPDVFDVVTAVYEAVDRSVDYETYSDYYEYINYDQRIFNSVDSVSETQTGPLQEDVISTTTKSFPKLQGSNDPNAEEDYLSEEYLHYYQYYDNDDEVLDE